MLKSSLLPSDIFDVKFEYRQIFFHRPLILHPLLPCSNLSCPILSCPDLT